jgi:hypothetical protein
MIAMTAKPKVKNDIQKKNRIFLEMNPKRSNIKGVMNTTNAIIKPVGIISERQTIVPKVWLY